MTVSRVDVVNRVLSSFKAPRYLEIGVAAGETFLNVRADRKVAVDPRFNLDTARSANEKVVFHEVTSDRFFSDIREPHEIYDVVYIDGLHTVEQTFRDFTNALHVLVSDGVIIIDDVLPTSYAAGLPSQADAMRVKQFTADADNSWMGDPYKLVYLIHAFFPSLTLRTVSENHGQAVIWRSDKARRDFRSFELEDVARMSFLDVITDTEPFAFRTLEQIEAELGSRARSR